MSLIFDGFPSVADAEAFRSAVKATCGRDGSVHTVREGAWIGDPDNKDDDALADVFPFELDLPIVLISRDGPDEEVDGIEWMARDFHGRFAGT